MFKLFLRIRIDSNIIKYDKKSSLDSSDPDFNTVGGRGTLLKTLPLILALLPFGLTYGSNPVSTTTCTPGSFCASEVNFNTSKSVYTTPDHKNIKLDIYNPSNPGDTKNMYLQGYGQDNANRINITGDIYLNIPKGKQKSELKVDFRNANYTGNINFIRDYDDVKSFNYISPPDVELDFQNTTFNGNINLVNYYTNYASGKGIVFNNSTLNGDIYVDSATNTGIDLINTTINGNVTWLYGHQRDVTQNFNFNGNTFNNSRITLGFKKGFVPDNNVHITQWMVVNNNTFNNVIFNSAFDSAFLQLKNNVFNGGTIILNNKNLSLGNANGHAKFDVQGSNIRADLIINGSGTVIKRVQSGSTSESAQKGDPGYDPDPQYQKDFIPIFEDQYPVKCKDGSSGCWSPHTDNTKPEKKDKDGNFIKGNVERYVPKPIYKEQTIVLGADLTFQALQADDKDNASKVYKTSSFEGSITLAGGNNNFVSKDSSKFKNGTLSISGGNNNFAISDQSSFDGFNISISRLIKKRSDISSDDLSNWNNCDSNDSICYQDPTNLFTITDSSLKNGYIELIGGKSNTFNVTSSSFENIDIRLLGGDINVLDFTDTPKIGKDVLIAGGKSNTLSFINTKLSSSTGAYISPTTTSTASSSNPFDPTKMTELKLKMIIGGMTPDFIRTLNAITPDLFEGGLTIGSSSLSDTTNTITFKNGAVLGDIIIQNGNAKNIKKVQSTINMSSNLFIGDIKASGVGMLTQTTLLNSGMIGDIITFNGVSYTTLDNSQIYGDIITNGGVNITQIKNGSVFAGSMDTYNGKNFVDLNMSLYTNPYDEVSRINTYNGESNVTLTISPEIAAVLTSKKIYPIFHIGNYNGGTANIAVEGPVSGSAHVDYSGGTANIIFADGFDKNETNDFFANKVGCNSGITDECIKSGATIISPKDQKFSVNGYTYQDGIMIALDAKKADAILKPFRDIYNTNFVSITIDKTGISPIDESKDGIYRMKIDGIIVGGEYNLPSTSDKEYEVTFAKNSGFIGEMFAKTDNTNFILSQGSKLVLDGGSNSVISKLSGAGDEGFKADSNTMFQATLAQKTNTIIDLATSGELVTRAFKKDTFSTMHILEIDHFNDAVFRVGIDASKKDTTNNINQIPTNTDRIIISDVATGQNLRNYLQVYQDYNHLITGDLRDKNILVAVVENTPKPNTSMIFDTSASNVQQGYDQVRTILSTRPVRVDRDPSTGKGTGAIDSSKDVANPNAMGYFIQSATTQVDPKALANTNNAITSNYTIFLANINNLNKRLGELRDNSYAQGAWSRIFSGLNSSTRGDESKIYSNNIQLGYDYGWSTDAGEQFLGGAFTYGYDTIKGNAYNGSANLFEFAGYYSWVGDEGFYTDTIVKYTYIRNKISIKDNALYDVPLNSNGFSIGQELGYRYYADKNKKFYIEPSGEVILGLINGGFINQVSQSGLMTNNDFTAVLDTDLNYVFNFRAKVGANFGYSLKSDKNQTDFRIGAFYVADVVNGGVINYKTNYSSAQSILEPNQQLMINLGVNSVVSENWRVYADIDSGFLGSYFNQNYLVSVGLRYEFGHALTPLAAKLSEEKRINNIKLHTQRLDEKIARVRLKQDTIRQNELFEKQKAAIIGTPKAQYEANISIRKKERELDSAKFKTLSLAIAKVINEALPDAELIRFQTQELKILEDAKERVSKNIYNDANLNRKNNEQKHLKETKDLQTKQSADYKELEDKQAKNKQDMLDSQAQAKEAFVQKQKQEKEKLIANQEKELASAKPEQKAKLQAKQAQDAKEFQIKQNKDMKIFTDRLAHDIKILQAKQNKALKDLKNAQIAQAKDLKNKQERETKDVEDFILRQQTYSRAYLKQISEDLENRQIRDKKALAQAQKKALSLEIQNAIKKGISSAEFEKIQERQTKMFQNHKLNITEDIHSRGVKNIDELKQYQTDELKDFKQKQDLQTKEFVDKQKQQKEDLYDEQKQEKEKLIANQEKELASAKPEQKAKLQAKHDKEAKDQQDKMLKDAKELQTKQAKALQEFKAKEIKELKDFNEKQIKESKELKDSIIKKEKDNEAYWKRAEIELKNRQAQDKKAIEKSQETQKIEQEKSEKANNSKQGKSTEAKKNK
ncbi:hypothetical protein BKH42_00475 [Helicobacter sp. 13S00482-2]|uniref:autotransporter outer membrane beta-barrel domain-containing protein n=1 Tax=Helicobacter sp. 13S00482-2 TaxID=1476200 RepID=UPI000BA7BC8E|nr:autotransporter outer membrane beta-barrel domain-containing protein [Helicobacter sp. 13S00482-2]PAF54426.1 hypothetical protein BKH42_00475 [Helicobacter sp. 13S00482-2]